MNVLSYPVSLRVKMRNNLKFTGNDEKAKSIDWSNQDEPVVYSGLNSLDLNPYYKTENNKKNMFHYGLSDPSSIIFNELMFLIQTLPPEELESMLGEEDDFGKIPEDYLDNANRERYTKEIVMRYGTTTFKEAMLKKYGKQIGAPVVAEVEQQPVTADIPSAQIPDEQPVEVPPEADSGSSPVRPEIPQVPANAVSDSVSDNVIPDDKVGNELAQDADIPVSSDLDFDSFGDVSDEQTETLPAVTDEGGAVTNEGSAEPVNAVAKAEADGAKELFVINGFDDIVGLDDVKERLMKNLIIPLKKENIEKLGKNNLEIENGFLLYGPPGCGKSALVNAIAKEMKLKIKKVDNLSDLEAIKRDAAKKFAGKKEPTLVFIDDLDEKINPNLVSTYSNLFANCAVNGVVLIATTNKIDKLDPILIREGCFDQHIEIPLPNIDDRKSMIRAVLNEEHNDIESNITDEDIEKLANATSGFSNQAIYYILNKAIKDQVLSGNQNFDIKAVRKVIETYAKERKIGKLMEDNPTYVYDTFVKRTIIESPKNFSEVAGMTEVKNLLTKTIVKRLKPEVRERFEKQNMPLFNDGFLFWGPPGCGKTFIAEALAGETGLPIYEIRKSTYDSSEKGKSIKNIEKIFDQLELKFEETGEYSILFVDEADTIFPLRGTTGNWNDEETNTMLQRLNNCTKKGIIPILATNFKDKLDTAVIRSGRIGTYVEIPTPDLEARIELFSKNIKGKDVTKNITDDDINELAQMLNGFASSDISHIAKATIDKALVDGVESLSKDDFMSAIKDFARERNIATDFSANDVTAQYDTYKKREHIKCPKDFSDVAGMAATKEILREAIVDQLKPEVQERFKKNNQALFPDGGFLFYGKPGNGKTFILESLAGETGLPLYKFTKADYEDSLKGESIKKIDAVFKQLELKFQKTGEYSLLLFDEADSLFPKRDQANSFANEETNQMLQYLNNAPSRGIIPLLATNYKDKIDPAILRTGRVGRQIEIPTPDLEARIKLFHMNIDGKEIAKNITDENIEYLAKMTEGYTSSDIAYLARTTVSKALVADKSSLSQEDFVDSIKSFAQERNLSEDFSELDRTAQYDTAKKREHIRYPKNFNDVAGMVSTKQELKTTIVDKLKPEVQERFKRNGVPLFTDGFMFYGKPGNGKTFIVEALAGETGLPLYKFTKADYEDSLKGESIKKIAAVFEQLELKFRKTGEYSILFFDEAETLFPDRSKGASQFSKDELTLMLQYLNNAPQRGIIPIIATNLPDEIDSAVLRSGRIGRHIEIPAPDSVARKALFEQNILGKPITKHITDDDISALVRMTNGFCAGDIRSLVNKAIEKALANGDDKPMSVDDFKNAITQFSHERNMPEINDNNVTSVYDTVLKRVQIKKSDPQSLDDIGGMKEVKDALFENVVSLADPEMIALYEENGLDLPNGILLYGPPGCGKTFIMKAVSAHSKLPLYQLKMSEAGNGIIHSTSNKLKEIFDQLRHKFEKTGEASILFLDECDTFFSGGGSRIIGGETEEVLNTLKEEMNNAGRDGIIIVAATNEIQNINPAILRDGRFDIKIKVDKPDAEARYEVIKNYLAKHKLTAHIAANADAINKFVELTNDFATAEITTPLDMYMRKHIARNKNALISAEQLEEVFINKAHDRLKLQQDILERQFTN